MKEISECCDSPLLYHVWEIEDGTVEYEQWDFCPVCLECCSGYDPDQITIDKITEGANNDTITRALKRLSKECGFGQKGDNVNSENDSIRDSIFNGPQECEP